MDKTFKRYINEKSGAERAKDMFANWFIRQDWTEEAIATFYKDTDYYWKSGLKDIALYRGMKHSGIEGIKQVRQDREPKDTYKWANDLINKAMKKKFGFDRSNSLFVTADYSVTTQYGAPYLIIPIGKFDWIFNPDVRDLFTQLVTFGKTLHIMRIYAKEIEARGWIKSAGQNEPHITWEFFLKELDNLISGYKKNVEPTRGYGGEISIKCNSYYYFGA